MASLTKPKSILEDCVIGRMRVHVATPSVGARLTHSPPCGKASSIGRQGSRSGPGVGCVMAGHTHRSHADTH